MYIVNSRNDKLHYYNKLHSCIHATEISETKGHKVSLYLRGHSQFSAFMQVYKE